MFPFCSLGLCSASEKSFDWILGKTGPGSAAVVIPGGGKEIWESFPGHNTVYLKRRKGFIRKALQHGYLFCSLCIKHVKRKKNGMLCFCR